MRVYLFYDPSGWHISRICVLLAFQIPAKMVLKVDCALYKSLFHWRRPTQAIYSSFQLLSRYVGTNKEYPVCRYQTLPSSTLQAKEGLTFGSISLLRGWTKSQIFQKYLDNNNHKVTLTGIWSR